MGAWAVSQEPYGFEKGTVRVIGGVLMSAWNIYPGGWSRFFNRPVRACWAPVDDARNSRQAMAEWRAKL